MSAILKMLEAGEKATLGEWHTGCMCDPVSLCNCRSILSDTCCGSICQITKRINASIGEGGNDAPIEKEAIANAQFIAASRNATADIQRLVSWVESAEHKELCGYNSQLNSKDCNCGLSELLSLIRS